MQLASGHQAEVLAGEEDARQQRDFLGYSSGLVRLTPGRWLFPAAFTKFADAIYNFKFRESDVVVMTWPKSGTTWMQEVVWTLRNNPDLSHPQASLGPNVRAPFLDFDMLLEFNDLPPMESDGDFLAGFREQCPGADPKDGIFLQLCQSAPNPRTIKTHLPFSLLPPGLLQTTKVVYVARNPKDLVVSYHHHSRLLKCHDFTGFLDQFVQYFVEDDLVYGPYWLHLKEAAEGRHHPNMHFVFYEDLKRNNMAELRKLNQFLGTGLTEEQLQNVAHYTSFSEMKVRSEAADKPENDPFFNQDVIKADGPFYRKGEVGSWKDRLSKEEEDKIDRWTKRHMSHLDLSFTWSA